MMCMRTVMYAEECTILQGFLTFGSHLTSANTTRLLIHLQMVILLIKWMEAIVQTFMEQSLYFLIKLPMPSSYPWDIGILVGPGGVNLHMGVCCVFIP